MFFTLLQPMVNNADDPAMANQEDESEQKKAIISDEVSPSLVHSPSFMQEDSERSREEVTIILIQN